MATPIDFKGSNVVFKGGAENVNDIVAFRNRACVVTAWLLSDEEIQILTQTRTIYQMQFYGGHLVPHFVTADKDEMKAMVADYGAMRDET
jgi:hypothetical protein